MMIRLDDVLMRIRNDERSDSLRKLVPNLSARPSVRQPFRRSYPESEVVLLGKAAVERMNGAKAP